MHEVHVWRDALSHTRARAPFPLRPPPHSDPWPAVSKGPTTGTMEGRRAGLSRLLADAQPTSGSPRAGEGARLSPGHCCPSVPPPSILPASRSREAQSRALHAILNMLVYTPPPPLLTLHVWPRRVLLPLGVSFSRPAWAPRHPDQSWRRDRSPAGKTSRPPRCSGKAGRGSFGHPLPGQIQTAAHCTVAAPLGFHAPRPRLRRAGEGHPARLELMRRGMSKAAPRLGRLHTLLSVLTCNIFVMNVTPVSSWSTFIIGHCSSCVFCPPE